MFEKKYISEMGLPGVEIVGVPRRSLLHMVRASQLSYNKKQIIKHIQDKGDIFKVVRFVETKRHAFDKNKNITSF